MMHSPRKLSIFTLPLLSLTSMGVQGAIAQSFPSTSDILESTTSLSPQQNVSFDTDKSQSLPSVSAETEKGRGKRSQEKDFQSLKIAPFNPVFLQENQDKFNQNAQSLGGKLQVSNAQGLSSAEFEGSSVAEVIIRFVNKQGLSVDKNGKPIKNRVPEDFVRRELKLKTGDRYQGAIVRRDIQQLYQLGLFDNVTVSLEQNGIDVNVIYNIQEASASSIGLGGGYNEDIGVYVSLKYTNRTIGTLPQRFSVFFEPSARDFLFDLQFISPYTAANDSLGYFANIFRKRKESEIFDQNIKLPKGQDVREIRWGGNIGFNRPIGDWQGILALNYTNISTRDGNLQIQKVDAMGNPLTWSGKGIDELYTVSLTGILDRRNNPFNPTSGYILSLTTKQSIPIGQGQIFMNQLWGNYIQYVPITWLTKKDPYALPEMFAFLLQGGTVIGDLPPEEGFVLGGSTSVRGYGGGRIGTGRSYVLASGEYRFPLWRDIGGVFFIDFESDLGSGNSVLGKPAIVRNKPGTGFGVGVGTRVRSPFGLIRLDVGVSNEGSVQFILGTNQYF